MNPARYHEPVLGDDGDRILVVGYTVSKWFKLEGEMQQELEELGFVLPKGNAIIKAMNWLEPQPEPAAGTTSPTTTQANPQPSTRESGSAPITSRVRGDQEQTMSPMWSRQSGILMLMDRALR